MAASERLRRMGEMQADIADLRTARHDCHCERAEPPDHRRGDWLEQEAPCWKDYSVETMSPHYRTGEPEYSRELRPQEEWCETCRRRQQLHEELTKKTRRLAAMRAALTRAARRARTDK